MGTVKLLEFLYKYEELDTFPCTFAQNLHLMDQKLNNTTQFFS